MLFNSYIFIFIFLPLSVLGTFLLGKINKKLSELFLLAMSLWFYSYHHIMYLVLIISSISINYLLSYLMKKLKNRINSEAIQKVILVIAIIANIGILFYFKYYDFFIGNINNIFDVSFVFLNIALPLGISFFTIQQISYIVDSYRGETEDYTFLEYAVYVSFFPQLVAGPIVLHNEFIPQLRDQNQTKVNYENLIHGITLFVLGLFKKTLIADIISIPVDWAYGNILSLSGFDSLTAMICFSLQLYFDFSAYSDMATGIAGMFNIRLPQNFNSPYKAVTISDFWKRWHITLTRFLTTYIYIPLGGNRKGNLRTYLNIFVVFTISGIWHGANYTYFAWGMLHGIALIFYRIFGKYFDKLPKIIKWFITFICVSVLFGLFRAEGPHDFLNMIRRILSTDWKPTLGFLESFNVSEFNSLYSILGIAELSNLFPALSFILILLGSMLIVLIPKNNYERFSPQINNPAEGNKNVKIISIPLLILISFIFVCCVFTLGSMSKFLYFNF